MPAPPESYTNSVGQRPATQERLRPADYGAAGQIIAKAGESFGRDLGEASRGLNEIQRIEAETAAQEADNQRNVARQTAIADFQTLSGKAAVDAAKEMPAKLRQIDQQVASSTLGNNRWARHLYDNVTARRDADDIAPIMRHAAKERVAWIKGVRQQGFENAVNDASTHWDDPKIVDTNIVTAGNHSAANVMADGITDSDQIEAGRRAGQGKAIQAVAKRIELERGATAAQNFIKDREGMMDPVDYTDVLTALAPRAEDEESDALVDGHIKYVGGPTTDQYYPGDGKGPETPAPEAEIPDHREVPLDIIAGHHINSGLGARTAPLKPDGTRGSSMHAGLDLQYAMGTPVRAMLSGIATPRSQGNKGYGTYIDLGHGNGLETRYAHLSRVLVKPGQPVKQGDIIGYSGDSGGVAPHLHFEARQNGAPIDPRTLTGRSLTIGGHSLAASQAARQTQPAPGDQEIDLAASIASVKNAGYNPRFEAKMISKIKERYGEGKQIKAAGEDQVKEQVASYLNTLSNPESFTSVDQLPLDVRTQLSKHPELEQGYRRWAQNNVDSIQAKADARDAKAKTAAENAADLEFATMIYGRPDAFKRLDLTDPRQTGNLSATDRIKYMGVQTSMQKSDAGNTKTANYDAIRTAVRRFAGKKPPDNIGLAFEEAARREEQWLTTHPGQPVSDATREGIAREVMTKYTLVTPGAVWGESRRTVSGYELPNTPRKPGSRLEVDSFEVVKGQLQQIWGRTPTDQEVEAEINTRSGNRQHGLRL